MGKKQKRTIEDLKWNHSLLEENYNSLLAQLENSAKTIRALRDEVHELTHTPETKADVEGAFQRGQEDAARRFRATLVDLATNYKTDFTKAMVA